MLLCTTLEDCGKASWEPRKAFFAPHFFHIEFISVYLCILDEQNTEGGIFNSHELQLKGFRMTKKAHSATAASSSKTVYFLSAMSNAVYRYHGEKNAESKQTIH